MKIFFGLWIVITIICQIQNRYTDLIRSIDLFAVIPGWSFFAPKPSTNDFHLLHRYMTDGGEHSEWQESIGLEHSMIESIWNPYKRRSKALFDMVLSLAKHSEYMDPAAIKITVPYILLLGHVESLPRPSNATYVQFLIVRSDGYATKNPTIVVVKSEFHRLDSK